MIRASAARSPRGNGLICTATASADTGKPRTANSSYRRGARTRRRRAVQPPLSTHTGHRPATTEERLPSVQAEAHTRLLAACPLPRNRPDPACTRGAIFGEPQRSYASPLRDRHSCSCSSTPRSSASASVRTSSSAQRMRSRSSIVSATTSASSASDLSRNERVGSSTSLMSSRTSSSGIRSPARYTRTQIPRERACAKPPRACPNPRRKSAFASLLRAASTRTDLAERYSQSRNG